GVARRWGAARAAGHRPGCPPALQHCGRLLGRWLAFEADRQQRRVAVGHRHACYLRADPDRGLDHTAVGDAAQQLAWLALDLLLLTAASDVRDDVVEDVE